MTENWSSKNGMVDAELVCTEDRIVIFKFEPRVTGKGHSKAALMELREKAGTRKIVAYLIGDVGSVTYSFWTEMHKRGLVDETVQ
jgi:hypothetical protein